VGRSSHHVRRLCESITGENQLNHDRVTEEGQELAALYALGALSQQEARAFDAHLHDGCQVCYAELAQFDNVVGMLGTDALPAAPPAYVRDLLTVRIEREATNTPSTSGSVIRFPEKQTPVQRTQTVPRSGFGRTILPWAAAAVLLIALGYSLTSWRSERQSLRAALDRERGLASETASQTANIKEELAKQSAQSDELAQINSVLSSPQWRIISLTGQAPAPDSSAKVYWDVRGNRWVVSADLPPAPPGKVYQLWFVTPAAKISAGPIKTDKRGHGFSVVQFPSSAAQVAAAAITLEPEGGSEQPTMPIYALGKAS
jgi:anti-sigma-K factor RskA